MALDGIVIANIRQELEQTLLGGRLYKIAQPETDELLFTIKTPNSSTGSSFFSQCQPAADLSFRGK